MANKLEDLLKLQQSQQDQYGQPNLPPQNPLQGLLQTFAGIAQQTGNPNTERGQIFQGLGNTYMGHVNTQNKQQFFSAVGQISQSQLDPAQKINLLTSLKAQHGTDYGLGVDDIAKQFTELRGQDVTMRGQDIQAQGQGQREWKPRTMGEAARFERIKAGAKSDKLTPSQQKSQMDIEDRKRTQEAAGNDIKESAQMTLDSIAQIEAGSKYFGVRSYEPGAFGLNPNKVKFDAYFDNLKSRMITNLMTQLKNASRTGATGFGQLNKDELKVLQDGATALKKTMSWEDAKPILDDMKVKLNKVVAKQGGQSDQQGGNGEGKTKSGIKYKVIQ